MRFKKEDEGRTTVLLRDKNGALFTNIFGATAAQVKAIFDKACEETAGGTPSWTERPRKPRVKKEKKADKAPAKK